MNDWIKKQSSTVKLSVVETPWGGTNLIAKDKVVVDELVLDIEEEAAISIKTMREHSILGKAFQEVESQGFSSYLLMILMLM